MDSAVARRIARELALVRSGRVGPHVFHGATMLPFLVDGDEVEIEPVAFDQIEPGDIVTYRDQQFFPTRRVIRIDRQSRSLILKGDAIPHLTFFVLEEDLLGRATAIVRAGERSTRSDPHWRATAKAIVARERRRALTAWLPAWLGLAPEGPAPAAAAAPVAEPAGIGDAWWRGGRAAIDLDGLQVVRALLAGAPDRAIAMLGRMKPRRFLDFARENGIAGDLLALGEAAGGGVSAVFEPILAELVESASKQRATNREVARHLHQVAAILEQRGIENLVLKGPALSLGYYGSLDRRRIGDLDLLVRRRDLRAASRALVEAGYVSRTVTPLGVAPTLWFVHHLEHEKDDVPVDLHHSLRVHPTFRFDEEDMWRTAGSIDFGERRVRVLSDAYVVLTLLLSIHNDIALGTADLHGFFDLERVLARAGAAIDWEAFFAARRRERTERIAVNVLALYLVVMGESEHHPALVSALEARRSLLVLPPDRRDYLELVRGATLVAKKRWAFTQLASGLPATTLWWLLGLPVHALVYRRIFLRDWKERLAVRRRRRLDSRAAGAAGTTPKVVSPDQSNRSPAGSRAPLDAFGIAEAALPPMAVRPLRLGSLAVEIRHDRAFAPDVLEELFRLEGCRHDATQIGTPDLRAHVFDATFDELHRMAPAPIGPVVRRDLEGIVEIHHQSASALMVAPRNGAPVEIALPLRPASARSATEGTPTTPDQMLVHSLMIVFYRALLELDCLHLHAAAVRWNGETSLFLGSKGAGKSTLCLALARAGATVLGEDHVLVRRRGGGFVVSGCDANMRLTAETESALLPQPPEGRKDFFGGVLKREFDLRQTVLPVEPFVDFAPRRIFFPVVRDRIAIEPMARARAVTRILDAIHDRHAIEGARDAQRLLDYVGSLVDTLEPYSLELSPRLSELDAVIDFVAGATMAVGS